MSGLVLDFDGVIADSARESFAVALATLAELRPDAPAHAADREGLYHDFLEAMPLGNRAEDFGTVLSALGDGVGLEDQTAYDAYRETLPPGWLDRFHQRYYEVRRESSRKDRAGWLALMPPYREFVELLRRRAGTRRLAIATAKDRRSVEALLETYGIEDLFPPENVVDKSAGRDKAEHLRRLSATLALPLAALTFVDDKVNHLDRVADLGVRCVLSAWGYNGPREHALARERGYIVCTLEDADRVLFGARSSDRPRR